MPKKGDLMSGQWDATFSLVCRCPHTRDLAVAVCTARPAVGNRVPFALAGGAALATQADTNPALGYAALEAIRSGSSASEAMALALDGDDGRERRQFSIIDAKGNTAVHTGTDVLRTNPWAGSVQAQNCVAAGNLLTGPEVVAAMAAAFADSTGFLGLRALLALEAGAQTGGDKRGKRSAALLLVRDNPHPLIDLRVDAATDPIRELRRIYEEYTAMFPLPL